MRKVVKITAVLTVFILIFRGPLFRLFVKYQETGSRPEFIISDGELLGRIDFESLDTPIHIDEIISVANEITSRKLTFTFNTASNDPSDLITSGKANCVGYAALFNSISNYLIQKNNLEDQISVHHKVAQLHFLGINVHQYIESPFFKDHDYNEITNYNTGETILIDPSISDYFWINTVKKL